MGGVCGGVGVVHISNNHPTLGFFNMGAISYFDEK